MRGFFHFVWLSRFKLQSILYFQKERSKRENRTNYKQCSTDIVKKQIKPVETNYIDGNHFKYCFCFSYPVCCWIASFRSNGLASYINHTDKYSRQYEKAIVRKQADYC